MLLPAAVAAADATAWSLATAAGPTAAVLQPRG
jgi:hypothetical protein